MKKGKKYWFLLLLFFTFLMPVNGLSSIDFSLKGSLEITLKEENNGVEGMEISLYHVANLVEKDYNAVLEYTEEFKECEVDFTNEALLDEISFCIKEDTPKKEAISDENGVVLFEDLPLGLYLVKQTNQLEGYSTIQPFFVLIPQIEEDNVIYDIKSMPKTEIYKLIDLHVKKIWNSTDNKIPESVKVSLYKDSFLIDTVLLNKENNWSYTWKQLEASDQYSVKEIDIPKGYTPTYTKDGYSFIITNTNTLPNTGMSYYPVLLFAFLGILFLTIGIVLERKENNHEK